MDVKNWNIFNDIIQRRVMQQKIQQAVSPTSWIYFNSLSSNLVFYVLMGMNCDIDKEDLLSIRIIAASSIYNMYKFRKTLHLSL